MVQEVAQSADGPGAGNTSNNQLSLSAWLLSNDNPPITCAVTCLNCSAWKLEKRRKRKIKGNGEKRRGRESLRVVELIWRRQNQCVSGRKIKGIEIEIARGRVREERK